MVRLIALPDPGEGGGAARLWINPAQIVSAAAIFDRSNEPGRLFVELKLQGLPLTRHWLATGSPSELEAAWAAFMAQLEGSERPPATP